MVILSRFTDVLLIILTIKHLNEPKGKKDQIWTLNNIEPGTIFWLVGLSVEHSTKPKCQLKLRPDLDGSTSGNIGTLPDGKDYSKFWNVSKLGFNSAVFLDD